MEGVGHDRTSNLGTRTDKLDLDSHRTNDLPVGDFPFARKMPTLEQNDTCQYYTQENSLPILNTPRTLTQGAREVRNYCQTKGWLMGPTWNQRDLVLIITRLQIRSPELETERDKYSMAGSIRIEAKET